VQQLEPRAMCRVSYLQQRSSGSYLQQRSSAVRDAWWQER
jgi:hypothetical protein